jgi:hypothetical protein
MKPIIEHIQITVRDMTTAAPFYTSCLLSLDLVFEIESAPGPGAAVNGPGDLVLSSSG